MVPSFTTQLRREQHRHCTRDERSFGVPQDDTFGRHAQCCYLLSPRAGPDVMTVLRHESRVPAGTASGATPLWMTGWRLVVLWALVGVSLLAAIGAPPVTR